MPTKLPLKTILVNGYPEAGKDTFVDAAVAALKAQGTPATKISSVDKVKEAATLLGWDGTKTPENREFLSDLKDFSTAAWDGPVNYIKFVHRSMSHVGGVLFVMVREPAEIERLKKELDAEALLIVRPGHGGVFTNHADRLVERGSYEHTVVNARTAEDLKIEAGVWALRVWGST